VAEFEQLALHSAVSPARVLPRQSYDQPGEDVVDRWPSGPVRVGPPPAYEVAVPAQDGARGDQAVAPKCSGQPPDQGGEHGSVRPVQAWSRVGVAEHGDLVPEHGDLVPEHEELDVLAGGRAPHQQDQSEDLLEDQVEQSQQHGGDHAEPMAAINHRWSAVRAVFWNPARHQPS
jgi:hypothetical protein